MILFILYDFRKKFKLFFSKFQFQNWNLGNMWTHNIQTHPPTSPTQHTNTPTDPPKTKTLITHKHTTHNPQTHNTEHTTQTLLWLYNRTQKKKNIYIYIYILLWVQACERVRCKEHRTTKFKKTKTRKKKKS